MNSMSENCESEQSVRTGLWRLPADIVSIYLTQAHLSRGLTQRFLGHRLRHLVDYSLDDAKDKLRWAKGHFDRVSTAIERFEQREAHSFSVEIHPDEGKYTIKVHGLEPVDPDWGLIIGDCIHNARTALDYLMVQLYALVTQTDPRQVKGILFPISDDPANFNSLPGVVKAREHLAFSGYLTRIEELQPYNVMNPSIWPIRFAVAAPITNSPGNPLSTLNRLDIRDQAPCPSRHTLRDLHRRSIRRTPVARRVRQDRGRRREIRRAGKRHRGR